MPGIDYRITDEHADPPGTDACHTEELVRLPRCAWCYDLPGFIPTIRDPIPALRNGYVTYGSFNNLAKLNEPLLATWAEILLQAPGSRMVLKAQTLVDRAIRERVLAIFTRAGVEPCRLVIGGYALPHPPGPAAIGRPSATQTEGS